MISPQADALFTLMAFFGPEPISEELFMQSSKITAPTDALQDALNNPSEFHRAARQLAQFSLAKINPVRNAIQVHRVVQAVTRGLIPRTCSGPIDPSASGPTKIVCEYVPAPSATAIGNEERGLCQASCKRLRPRPGGAR
jgi:hypothetical protein